MRSDEPASLAGSSFIQRCKWSTLDEIGLVLVARNEGLNISQLIVALLPTEAEPRAALFGRERAQGAPLRPDMLN